MTVRIKIGTTPKSQRAVTRDRLHEAVSSLSQGSGGLIASYHDGKAWTDFAISSFAEVSGCLVSHHAYEEYYMLNQDAKDKAVRVTLSNGQVDQVNNITLVPVEWALSSLYWFLWTGGMNPAHAWINSYSDKLRW